MTPTEAEVLPGQAPVVRAVAYSLLAHCFAYPDGSGRASQLHDAAAAATEFLHDTPLSSISGLVEATTCERLQAEHIALFSLTSSSDCPTYETAYIDSDLVGQTHRMAAIAGLYRMFGVEVPSSCARPDDISAELEFMSFLNCKEIYAQKHLGPPRVAQAARAQRLFLAEHLGCWLKAFARAVQRSAACSPFYAAVAQAAMDWVEADIARLGATPAQLVAEPAVLTPPLPSSHGPELASSRPLIPLDAIH